MQTWCRIRRPFGAPLVRANAFYFLRKVPPDLTPSSLYPPPPIPVLWSRIVCARRGVVCSANAWTSERMLAMSPRS